MDDPEGIYVCTARYNNLVRGIEYTLRYPSSKSRTDISEKLEMEPEKCDIKCGDNAHCELVGGQPTCLCNRLFKGDPKQACEHDCHSHSDCPKDTVCFRDLKCRNPCVHSIRCGDNALCRVENSFPVCYCPENFVGDPKSGCINSIQQDAPPSALNTSSTCTRKCVENSICVNEGERETCKCRPEAKGNPDVACEIGCQSHDECPDDLSCNTLNKCHSPCIHNIRCGEGASCAVIKHRPQCYCPRDTFGDPMKECSSEYQGDQPPSSSPSDASPAPDTESNDKCKRDLECAPNQRCMKPTVDKGKECLDPCVTRRCGSGAECKTQDHRTFCACKDGFEGNANKECRPIKYEDGAVEPLRGPKETLSVARKPSQADCNKCGPFSKCSLDKDGKQQCSCLTGRVGQPPNCAEECQRNSDCPLSHVCLRDSRLEFPYCAKICSNKICGANSKCREANGVIPADCECPLGFGGDPYLHCQNLNDKIGETCKMDEECGPTLRCETGASYRKCVDPCDSLKCSESLECVVQDHQATCICPSGYTGNPSIGCTKDFDFNNTSTAEKPCGGLSCGPHSECRIENGRPSCSCRSYALGEPPSCYQECKSSGDCEPGLSCVHKRCQHSCSSCGIYTKCLISRNPTQGSFCTCLEGFRGDPLKGCSPINA
ncbi:hypothetical protein Ocin01_08529 [Orchesella cincta]|uniref:EGF-like domain-containing protein n=1 Tax=Orchesella cincta TaxID=48709 RepID=A0A1D2MZA7_ORCCI|nr:hypothetical protein Ocin01_08529 [Orchesella cincta]